MAPRSADEAGLLESRGHSGSDRPGRAGQPQGPPIRTTSSSPVPSPPARARGADRLSARTAMAFGSEDGLWLGGGAARGRAPTPRGPLRSATSCLRALGDGNPRREWPWRPWPRSFRRLTRRPSESPAAQMVEEVVPPVGRGWLEGRPSAGVGRRRPARDSESHRGDARSHFRRSARVLCVRRRLRSSRDRVDRKPEWEADRRRSR